MMKESEMSSQLGEAIISSPVVNRMERVRLTKLVECGFDTAYEIPAAAEQVAARITEHLSSNKVREPLIEFLEQSSAAPGVLATLFSGCRRPDGSTHLLIGTVIDYGHANNRQDFSRCDPYDTMLCVYEDFSTAVSETGLGQYHEIAFLGSGEQHGHELDGAMIRDLPEDPVYCESNILDFFVVAKTPAYSG